MSEEKKDQQDFLSGHEELLNSLNNKKEDTGSAETAPIEEAAVAPAAEPEAPAAEAQPAPIVEEKPAIAPEPAAVIEEPIAEEPIAEEVIAEEVIIEEIVEEAAPVADPEPVLEEVEEVIVDQKVVAEVPPVVTEIPAKPAPKKKEPANQEEAVKQKHTKLEQAEVKEVLKFINKYVKPAAVGILIVCVLFLGNSLIRSGRLKKEAQADSALMVAQSAQDYQTILDNFGKTPSAPLALLGLAQEKFNAGNVAEAAELYADFLKKYPNHDMVIQAEYNEITCKEASGQYAEAAAAYGEFNTKHDGSHLAPVALLSKARCLESMDNFAEAKQVYDDVTAFYPDSGWAQLAEQNLRVVNSKLK